MGNRESVVRLSESQIGGAVQETLLAACLRMKRSIDGVPLPVRNIFYEKSRADRRGRAHFLGSYPEVAFAFAAAGAPDTDVFGPIRDLEAMIRNRYYRRNLPTLEAIQQREEDANHRLNKLQLILNRLSPSNVILDARDAAFEQKSATETLLEVLDALHPLSPCSMPSLRIEK